ncbi:MAG: sulfatase-like hydrolase/transferase [Bacteroidales bacterium]
MFREGYGLTKGFVYEGGIRVPLIASWPGNIRPGTRSNHISGFWDMLPTICEIAGASILQKLMA